MAGTPVELLENSLQNLLYEVFCHLVFSTLSALLSTDDRSPIQHELFHKFLQYRDSTAAVDPPWGAQDALLTWQEKRHPWLELNMVNRETTNGVRVTAVSYYMGCKENQQGKKFWVSTPIMVYM